MPAVPGVLLDAVDHQVADDHLLASRALAEVLEAGQQAVGGVLLFMQDAQRLGCLGGIRAHRLEIGSRRPVDPACRLARGDPVAPVPLHFAEVAQQAQQAERGGPGPGARPSGPRPGPGI